jgi:hypothetical protein
MENSAQMREITSHVENDRQPRLFAGDNVAPGNAPQQYKIYVESESGDTGYCVSFDFTSLEKNGVTNEVLLAVCIDRLEGFQSGPFACEENATALTLCRGALHTLHERTKERNNRGVENKHEK